MIELKSISKYYNNLKALENVSLTISSNKIYGLLGPNGSGKTTLIKIILKIIDPSKGEVVFNNEYLENDFFNSVGYLPEERGLFQNSSLYDVLIYFGKLKNLTNPELKESVDYWLEQFNLQDLKKLKIAQLSKGNQQKAQLILALLNYPKLLILDEPFTGFDIMSQKKLKEILISLVAPNRVIIISTHLLSFVKDICTDVLFLNNGKLIYSGLLESLLNEYSKKKPDDGNYFNLGRESFTLEEIFLKKLADYNE